jgi:hypothetical protein
VLANLGRIASQIRPDLIFDKDSPGRPISGNGGERPLCRFRSAILTLRFFCPFLLRGRRRATSSITPGIDNGSESPRNDPETELKPLISPGKTSPLLPFWQACVGIRCNLRSTTYRAASGENPSADLPPAAGPAPQVPLVAVSVQKNCDPHGQDGEMYLRNQRDATE